jgi:hypothetical protein
MPVKTEGFNGGSTSYITEDCMEISSETLESLSDGVNQLLDETGIFNIVDDGLGVRTQYSNDFVGPNVIVYPPEDITSDERKMLFSKQKRCLALVFNLGDKKVVAVEDHNFDNGYSNSIKDWIPYTILEGLKFAKKKDTLSWTIL